MGQNNETDILLWNSFRQGDMESFRTLYYNHFSRLYEYGMRLVNDAELVKDGIHDLFIRLWERKDNLGEVTAVTSYLIVSLRSVLYNFKRKEDRMKTTDIDILDFRMVFTEDPDLIKKETVSEQSQKLLLALNQLTPRQKEVIYLRYFVGMNYEEIADVLKITVKATYKLKARSLETLRNVLNVSVVSLITWIQLMRGELL